MIRHKRPRSGFGGHVLRGKRRKVEEARAEVARLKTELAAAEAAEKSNDAVNTETPADVAR